MSASETPTKVGQMVDDAINRLNGKWDLQLPRLHGRDADPLQEHESLSEKCSSLILQLCSKTDSINGILNQFDTDILPLFSDWQWKPSQTPGTLPALPITKSAIHRDLTRKHGSGPVQLTKTNRKHALHRLHSMLLEEYNLTEMSDSYNRTLGPPDLSPTAQSSQFSFETAHEIPDASSGPTPSTPDPMTNPPGEPSLKYGHGQPSKRTMSSSKSSPKRQQRGSRSFVPRSDHASSDPRLQSISHDLAGCPDLKFREDQKTTIHQVLPTSFTTEASSKQSAIFSDVEPQHDSLSISSNDTSMVSSTGQLTEDLLPTQEFDELMEDEGFRRSIGQEFLPVASSSPPTAPFDNNSPQSKSLFQKHDLPPVGNNFNLAYEIERLASTLNIKPTEYWSQLDHGPSNLTPAESKTIGSKHKGRPLLTKPPLQDWTRSDEKRKVGEPEPSLALSGSLEWSDPKDSTLFKLSLNPVQREQSCRFHRKFGSDRFLVLSTPILSETPANWAKQPSNQKSLHEWICNLLATESLEIAGRHWRVFFVAHDKAKRKKKSKENEKFNGRLKLHLFAEHGCGISKQRLRDFRNVNLAAPSRISVEDMLWWHMPLGPNLNSTDLKLFSRIHLGLSKTTSTLALQPHEFLYEPDLLGKLDLPGKPDLSERQVMNDGCALMSYVYAKAIWKASGGTGVAPSAFQGRIGGAKGLWLVDYTDKHDKVSDRDFWIEISDSQLKIKPHPRNRPESDESQRTFELLKYSPNATEGHLNTQLINILEDRGVPRDVLKQFLIADLVSLTSTLDESMRFPETLRLWVKENTCRNPASKIIGKFPADTAQQCNMLLEAGFQPRANRMVVDCVDAILKNSTASYVEKLRIKLPCSTTVFCAPDPTGLLHPGEVYLGFSQEKIDPRSGLSENVLRDINVLVARNPAYLSSDMQLRRAVYYDELRHYKDVILFSTQGDTPLASLLSGGDYDGDMVTVIWEPLIVDKFENVSKTDLPCENQLGMVNKSRALQDVFRSPKSRVDGFGDFMRGCIQFNSTSSLMGQCSTEHEKLIYSLSLKRGGSILSQPGPVKLAALAGYLVDQSKQGWEMQDWHRFRREVCGPLKLETPAYKTDTSPGSRNNGNCSNIIDHLKFVIARPHADKVCGDFQNSTSDFNYDDKPALLWKRVCEWVRSKGKSSDKEVQHFHSTGSFQVDTGQHAKDAEDLFELLFKGDDCLRAAIDALSARARKILREARNSPAGSTSSNSFAAIREALFEEFRAIMPKAKKGLLWLELECRGPDSFSLWSLLKASYLYFSCYSNRKHCPWIWYVAGPELCFLRADEEKGYRVIVHPVHQLMTIDKKYARGVLEARDGTGYDGADDDEEEEEMAEYSPLEQAD